MQNKSETGNVEQGRFSTRFSSRMSYAFLNNLGLPELCAEDERGYVQVAIALAHDAMRMTELRKSLRARMAAAPLTDERRFVQEMEAAYREMWQAWCRGQSGQQE